MISSAFFVTIFIKKGGRTISGGHFTNCGYDYHKVRQFADELEEEIRNNNVKDEYEYAPNYSPEVIEYLKKQVPKMRKMSEIMRCCDYLYSGDTCDDSFMERVKEVEIKYWEESNE